MLHAGGHKRKGVSGGERKRVSIGHEMLINPSVLMLDGALLSRRSCVCFAAMVARTILCFMWWCCTVKVLNLLITSIICAGMYVQDIIPTNTMLLYLQSRRVAWTPPQPCMCWRSCAALRRAGGRCSQPFTRHAASALGGSMSAGRSQLTSY